MIHSQITNHNLHGRSNDGRKDDQEVVQVENVKDQIIPSTNVQSRSNYDEKFKGRKNGRETSHDESLNEYTSFATLDQLTYS